MKNTIQQPLKLKWTGSVDKSGKSDHRLMKFESIAELMKVESISECSPWSILQNFRLSLSYHNCD